MEMNCQKCNSVRVVFIHADGKDLCTTVFNGIDHDGYVPDIKNVANDTVDIAVCLECGQTQGKWPVADPDFGDNDDDHDKPVDTDMRDALSALMTKVKLGTLKSHSIREIADEHEVDSNLLADLLITSVENE